MPCVVCGHASGGNDVCDDCRERIEMDEQEGKRAKLTRDELNDPRRRSMSSEERCPTCGATHPDDRAPVKTGAEVGRESFPCPDDFHRPPASVPAQEGKRFQVGGKPATPRPPCIHDSSRIDGWLDDHCLLCGADGYWREGREFTLDDAAETQNHPAPKVLIRVPDEKAEGEERCTCDPESVFADVDCPLHDPPASVPAQERSELEKKRGEKRMDEYFADPLPLPDEKAEPIRPRTDSERRAYIAGFASAINDATDHGIQHARDTLRVMVDVESPTPPDEAHQERS